MASGNMKDIKRRIKSVESTMQITKAMELVASSKLRKAKEKADKARPYFNALYDTMCEIQAENPDFLSQYSKKRNAKTVMLIVIAGDRGLAGGFNSNVLKLAQTRIDELKDECNIKIIAIGKKAGEYFSKRGYELAANYPGVAEGLKIHNAADIADKVTAPYAKGEVDRVELFRTEYVSPLVQRAEYLPILPLDIKAEESRKAKELPIYEPSAGQVFDAIVPKYITGIIFGAVVDSFASEQAARRTAMESATDNASEMISNLSLVYNRARQASITQEITEIVGGASAQE
ncbi:MAG: ATP synthase F1 subunit gamma [Ruminococcus sp.]|nr:ATP synthase F1 subunit gamma [Ruminococcus sp.]MCM1381256.1 ATP synthase F1 subunit gamma [Muribaculaceae bacterium]MCM1478641.1 ATP synthase F1 subunit gamma [Muribaculaceae bacterium]